MFYIDPDLEKLINRMISNAYDRGYEKGKNDVDEKMARNIRRMRKQLKKAKNNDE